LPRQGVSDLEKVDANWGAFSWVSKSIDWAKKAVGWTAYFGSSRALTACNKIETRWRNFRDV
jgi:hypothetical protein